MKKWAFLLLIILAKPFISFADEGMWLPIHIQGLIYTDMEKMGLQLTPEEIYSINHSSLKDAVVNLGGGFCTGEIISPEGLMITNHHCGYEYVQAHSTVENDILTNGFWAATKADELPNDGLFVQFLVRIEDVTNKVLANVKTQMTGDEREEAVDDAISQIVSEAEKGDYDANVRSFFDGNEYYLFVYETYRDVRLVGAPPESIGKFGGDTDNWMWPRHTGDFSLFRVYMSPDGKPAEYSPDNIPLRPKHFLPISLDGYRKGDFAMVMGYPGHTDRYMTSYGVKLTLDETNPARVKIRQKRLEILRDDMDSSKKIRLQYAAKYANVSNYWKYFIGQSRGLKKLHIYDKKVREEKELQNWIKDKKTRVKEYGHPLEDIGRAYADIEKYNLPFYYHLEAGFGVELVKFGYKYKSLLNALESGAMDKEDIDMVIRSYKSEALNFFKDYHPATDKKVFAALFTLFYQDIPENFQPDVFQAVKTRVPKRERFFKDFNEKNPGDFKALADYVYGRSVLVDSTRLFSFFEHPDAKTLKNDPGYRVAISIYNSYKKISIRRGEAMGKLDNARRPYIAALINMESQKKFYPDANSTMRLTYGKVLGYDPRDAVYYDYFTTLKGVIEKEDPDNPEFIVPQKLNDLYKTKDFGPYGENGKLHVCFITDNDITGGNSGSPVINGKGQLIGLAFDGNWEAMSGDIVFEPQLQRCISVDIRYVLFIMDKFAGAKHLVDEMQLVKTYQ